MENTETKNVDISKEDIEIYANIDEYWRYR